MPLSVTTTPSPLSWNNAHTAEPAYAAQEPTDALGKTAHQRSQDRPAQLDPEQQKQIESLAARDREVRAHEMAHLAAAGPYARGGPSFTYQTGPDGRRYAIGGEVSIDTSPDPNNPHATLTKARIIQAAATAPASPSGQDRAVAAAAAQMAAEAQQEISAQHRASVKKNSPYHPSNDSVKTLGGRFDDHA
ncbi:MAG: putative metalloprotease CJM1_0395 family protein [Gammaproteobacteria bacterium]|nr:putative metalloprotease CJM1_0395 family protein [Gammaproteobacteria bacterium]